MYNTAIIPGLTDNIHVYSFCVVSKGDRVGICVTQFDPKLLERGLVSSPGALPTIVAAVISARKIPYYKGTVATKAKFHITMGHETVMGKVSFFGRHDPVQESDSSSNFDFSLDYLFQDELQGSETKAAAPDGATDKTDQSGPLAQFAVIEFEKPVTCSRNCLVIGSKLDTDVHANMCRLAFHGQLLEAVTDSKYVETLLPRLKIFKYKAKEGLVERKVDDYSVIARGLFKKESKIELFVGMKVSLSTGEEGTIEGGFGQSGKFKVRIPGKYTQVVGYIVKNTSINILAHRNFLSVKKFKLVFSRH